MNGEDLPPNKSDAADEESADVAEVLQFPGFSEETAAIDEDAYSTEELAALSGDPVPPPSSEPEEPASDFDEFTEEHYVQSTTREYQGLAESVAEAAAQDHEQSAVAAAMPGLDQGVIGFEDMTGDEGDAEAVQQEDRARRSDLMMRVGTGLALLVLFFGALNAGPVWITLFLSALIVVAVNEFYQAVRPVGYRPVVLFGLLGAVGVMFAAWTSGPFAAGGVVAAVVLSSALWYSIVPRRYPLANVAITVMGTAWIALTASFAIPIFRAGEALALVTALVVLTALNDVGAYFVGRALGSRKLAPVLSPNKTVEGLVGGFVVAVLVGFGMGQVAFFEPIDVQSGIALGVAVSLFGTLGDLAESTVKRLLGIKDMGSILPGHGGVLDRIDAFLLTIPAAYLLFDWFGYL